MSQSIGDFFVKIGLKVDNLQKLDSLTTRLNNASVAAGNLVKNLNKLPNALAKLNVPIIIKKSGTVSDTEKSQYKEAIGPLLGQTQYPERAGPHIEYFKKDLKEKADAFKSFQQQLKDFASKQSNVTFRNAGVQYENPIGPQEPKPPVLPAYDKPIGPSVGAFQKYQDRFSLLNKAIQGIGKTAGVSIGGEAVTALLAGNLAVGLFISALSKAIELVSKFITSVIDFTEELFKFNVATGISVQSLQQWQYAAAKAGVSGKEVANALKNIQLAQAQIQLGEGNIAPWALLGIDPKQDAPAVLWQIHERIKQSAGLSEGMARLYAQKFGLSDDMYQMLRRDNLELSDLNRNLAINQRQVTVFDKLNGAIGQAKMQFSALGANIGEILAPSIQIIVDGLTDIIQLFNFLMPLLRFVAEAFNVPLRLIDDILKGIGKIINWASGVYDIFTPEKKAENRSSSNPATKWLNMTPEERKNNTASSITPSASLSSSLSSSSAKVTGIENQNVNINLSVNGAGDPKKVAEMTSALIKKHLDNQNSSVLELSQLAIV